MYTFQKGMTSTELNLYVKGTQGKRKVEKY